MYSLPLLEASYSRPLLGTYGGTKAKDRRAYARERAKHARSVDPAGRSLALFRLRYIRHVRSHMANACVLPKGETCCSKAGLEVGRRTKDPGGPAPFPSRPSRVRPVGEAAFLGPSVRARSWPAPCVLHGHDLVPHSQRTRPNAASIPGVARHSTWSWSPHRARAPQRHFSHAAGRGTPGRSRVGAWDRGNV